MTKSSAMHEMIIPQEARLDGQVAVLSGAGRGIGRAAALRLAQVGARTVLLARTPSQIQEACEALRAQGWKADAFACDVSRWPDVHELAEKVMALVGPPHIVAANAGVIDPVGDTWTLDPEEWAQNLAVNLTGAFHLVRAFLPAMMDAGRGVFIFTSSGAATHAVGGWSAYCAAKAGLDLFAKTLAEETRRINPDLRIHLLYPGIVDTAMQERIRQIPSNRFPEVERFQTYKREGLLRPPEEPAALIWWLATPFAKDYHGRVASLDDPMIRQRLALDLGLPMFKARS
ncbi:MAG: SDR family oxidoreductase [Desulfosoma sp.]